MKTYAETINYLYSFIPQGPAKIHPGETGLLRTKLLLKNLGNPENKYKIIHIAGTSGKGSTATIISYLLSSQNKKTGLHLSPHIKDLTERYQINNKPVTHLLLIKYAQEIVSGIQKTAQGEFGAPSYFEILVSLGFYIFAHQKVDYAVVETGMGGWYDATNAPNAHDKVCVLTRIGLDHTHILGKTIAQIASQKAKIIHPGSLVISTAQVKSARKVIDKVAKENNLKVKYVADNAVKSINTSIQGTTFNLKITPTQILKNLHVSLVGYHQAENASLAIKTVYEIAKRDKLQLQEKNLRNALLNTRYAGRFEIKKVQGKTVILDGAHNPQKMRAFIKSLKALFPNSRFHVLIAFKRGKDYSAILKYLLPYTHKFIITSFFTDQNEPIHFSEDPRVIGQILEKLQFKNTQMITPPKLTLKTALKKKKKKTPLLITGSLYLIGSIYHYLQDRL